MMLQSLRLLMLLMLITASSMKTEEGTETEAELLWVSFWITQGTSAIETLDLVRAIATREPTPRVIIEDAENQNV